MVQRKIIYLINPISGTQNKSRLPHDIARRTDAAGIEFEILPTVASGDYGFVEEKILEEKFTDIVICGGDGSVNTVVQQLHHLPVNFGIIPMGSGNGLANTAGISAIHSKAIDIVLAGNSRYIDAFTINKQFACMLCGIGFDAQVAHDFAKQKKRGLMTYANESFKNYFKANPYRFTIVAENYQLTTNAFFISIANSNQFGNNFTIAPKASLNDGLLDIVIVQQMSKVILPMAMLQQISFGNPTSIETKKNSNVIYFQTKKIEIINHHLAPLHIDGEPKEVLENISAKILPNSFKLLQP